MIITELNSDFYEVKFLIKELIYGNKFDDYYSGYYLIDSTTLKIRGYQITIMVFDKDLEIFKDYKIGDSFNAIVKKWKGNVFHFKTLKT